MSCFWVTYCSNLAGSQLGFHGIQGNGWRKKLSKLLNIIRAHSGLRAFQEFIDSFHNAFCRLTINTGTQGEQTSWSDLVLINTLGTEQSRQTATPEFIASPFSKLPKRGRGTGGSHQGPRPTVSTSSFLPCAQPREGREGTPARSG